MTRTSFDRDSDCEPSIFCDPLRARLALESLLHIACLAAYVRDDDMLDKTLRDVELILELTRSTRQVIRSKA